MNNIFKINISKFEKVILSCYLIVITLSIGIVIYKPMSSDWFFNITYLFESVIISLLIYIVSKAFIIMFIKLSVALWGKSWIWEYRIKFVAFIVNSSMYLASLFSLISIIRGFIQLDPQLMIYSCGFLGVLVGGYDGKEIYAN